MKRTRVTQPRERHPITKEERVGAILAAVEATPVTFADIQAAWKANPYITYNELASYFGTTVTEIMRAIDAHIAQNPLDPN
jgi:hypothetical protein